MVLTFHRYTYRDGGRGRDKDIERDPEMDEWMGKDGHTDRDSGRDTEEETGRNRERSWADGGHTCRTGKPRNPERAGRGLALPGTPTNTEGNSKTLSAPTSCVPKEEPSFVLTSH